MIDSITGVFDVAEEATVLGGSPEAEWAPVEWTLLALPSLGRQ
jgi:hypothetical protein